MDTDTYSFSTFQFERVLGHIFAKYSTPGAVGTLSVADGEGEELLQPQPTSVLTDAGLDKFAIATNGQPFTADAKEELAFLDSTDEGDLT